VYWFRRPPYVRYAAAALLVIGTAWIELSGPNLVRHPFAVHPIRGGVQITDADLRWRDVPAGLLPTVDAAGVAARPIPEGAPLLPADVTPDLPPVPEGWWAVEIPLPGRATAGQAVQVVVLPDFRGGSARVLPGRVLEPTPGSDEFGFTTLPGLVAVPGEDAALAALAALDGRIAVLMEP
jgi:hypothetical protein